MGIVLAHTELTLDPDTPEWVFLSAERQCVLVFGTSRYATKKTNSNSPQSTVS